MDTSPDSLVQDEDDHVLQLITDKGPAYILKPADTEKVSPAEVLPSKKENESNALEYKIAGAAQPASIAVVIGSVKAAGIKPIEVIDDESGQRFVAEPADNVNDLNKKPTLYLPDTADLSKPVVIYHPTAGSEIVAFPSTPQTSDNSKRPQFISAQSFESGLGPSPTTEPTPRDSPRVIMLKSMTLPLVDSDYTLPETKQEEPVGSTKPILHQVVTNHGPAFTLRLYTGTGGPAAGDDNPDVDFILASQSQTDQPPVMTGQDELEDSPTPLLIGDPGSGQIMVAEPMEDVDDLSNQVSGFFSDSDQGPIIEVYNPATKCSGVAVPCQSFSPVSPMDTVEADVEPLDYGNVEEQPTNKYQSEIPFSLPDTRQKPHSISHSQEPEMDLSEPGRSHTPPAMFSLPTTPRELSQAGSDAVEPNKVKPDHAKTDESYQSPSSRPSDEEESTFDDYKPWEPTTNQVLTSAGAAYVLTPVTTPRDEDVQKRDEDSMPTETGRDYESPSHQLVADLKPLLTLPVVVGSQPLQQRESLIIEDPDSHQIFRAEPVHNLDVLEEQPTAFVDKDTKKPVQIHYPEASKGSFGSDSADEIDKPVSHQFPDSTQEGSSKLLDSGQILPHYPRELDPSVDMDNVDSPRRKVHDSHKPDEEFPPPLRHLSDDVSMASDKNLKDPKSQEIITKPHTPSKQQIVTDLGPAFILVPEEKYERLHARTGGSGGGGDDSSSAHFILASAHSPATVPKVTGTQQSSGHNPVVVRNRNTNETFRAIPAESLKDLDENPSLYNLDSDGTPMVKVIDPSTGLGSYGVQTTLHRWKKLLEWIG